ncbi:ABC transporter ATP-binding protein [Acrocarpospora catenulata]|uniref:ABC transporter ATP-binding protein n=1 Tax=Acrocarpospora catenulata TaxID=2836182 RepID=UPI002023B6F9|nr:ABC transporter ATP-binding protein [Acrocarpospora catenulata]
MSTDAVPSQPAPPALAVSGLTVRCPGADGMVPIAEEIFLTIAPGEAVAVVGESGSGKSVTARAILNLLPHGLESEGTVEFAGESAGRRPRGRRGARIAMVMQDPFTTLNPLHRIRDIVCETLRTPDGKRLGRRERRREAVRRLAEVGIADPAVADAYPFELSGGMRQRVGIAAAIAEEPLVLIADEPTTALDQTTQSEILALLDRLRETRRMALLLITHDLRVAAGVCGRVYVMYAGQVIEELPADRLLTAARHPYTARLAAADPPLDRRLQALPPIPGSVPAPGGRPHGCRFAPRCGWATSACTSDPVTLSDLGTGHQVRCARVGESLDLTHTRDLAEVTPGPAPTGEPIIVLREVTKRYGHKLAVDGVDFEVHAGESVGIVGESGSGKTSVARMMVGLEPVTSGSLEVRGIDVTSSKVGRDGWATVRSTVQMAFQDPSSTLNPARTVGGTITETLRLTDVPDRKARAAELLQMVGLDAGYANLRPKQLSGGERQRVAIARALARDPRVLLCDEVVSALDVSVQAHVLNLLNDLRRTLGISLVFITHDLAVVRQIADRVYVMKSGKVVEHGLAGDVLSRPRHPYTQSLIASIPAHA